jgi:homoserine kinase
VRVPASSANLGPGFDVMGAALDLHMEVDVVETGRFAVHTDLRIARDRRNLIVRGFSALHPADGFEFTIRSDIPLSGGLGTSAAAIVAGLVAADHLYELDAPIFEVARELEGHPDNVAAALRGGFVVCTDDRADRFEPPPGMEAVIAIPPDPVPTEEARAALPAEVPMADAVHNIGHASLLVLGLQRNDLDLVARGLEDRVHQPRRESLYPRSMELLRKAQELGAVGASISGAGPTVLFWIHWQQTGAVMDAVRQAAPDCDVRRVQFTPAGADVREL